MPRGESEKRSSHSTRASSTRSPPSQTFFYEPAIAPGEKHFDVLFLFDVSVEAGVNVRKPPWYEALEWFDTGTLQSLPFARQHEDVAEAWLKRAGRQF